MITVVTGVTIDCDMKCPYCGKTGEIPPPGEYGCPVCQNRFVVWADGKAYPLFEKFRTKTIETRPPDLAKILCTDPSSGLVGTLILLFWVSTFFLIITGIRITKMGAEIGIEQQIIKDAIASIIGVIVIIVRTIKIRSAFRFGMMNMARILEIKIIRLGTYFKVRYEFCGKEYIRSLPIVHQSDYQIGDEIEIVVDKNNPENAVILENYRN